MTTPRTHQFDTLALHAGGAPDPATGARATPIYQTASFVFPDTDHAAALVQHGARRPRLLAHLESDVRGARGAHRRARGRRRRDRHRERPGGAASRDRHAAWAPARTSSRRARSTAARTTCSTTRCRASASTTTFVDPRDLDAWRAAIRPETRLLFGETLGNPGLDVLDIPRVAALAHEHGLPLLVDSTFTTPWLMRPFEHGADLVVPFGDQVPVRPRRRDRRGAGRRRPLRLGRRRRARQVPDADRAVRRLPRHGVHRGVDDRGVPAARAARRRCATSAPAWRRSPRSRCCRASRRCRCGWRGTSRTRARIVAFLARASAGRERRLSGAARPPRPRARAAPAAARLRRGVQLRPRAARARRAGASSRR